MKRNLRNMLDGLVMFASLGFTNLSKIEWRIRYWIACYDHATRPRNFVINNGVYRNRRGELCHVTYNEDGWLDGLPFIVEVTRRNSIAGALGLGGASRYTVDHDGLVYPSTPWRKPDDLVPAA